MLVCRHRVVRLFSCNLGIALLATSDSVTAPVIREHWLCDEKRNVARQCSREHRKSMAIQRSMPSLHLVQRLCLWFEEWFESTIAALSLLLSWLAGLVQSLLVQYFWDAAAIASNHYSHYSDVTVASIEQERTMSCILNSVSASVHSTGYSCHQR